MLQQSYTTGDLEYLTTKARTLWEYDFTSTPKTIKRRANLNTDHIPLRAIYRMVIEDWSKPEFNCYHFPFITGNFSLVLGLAEGWNITFEDRKYIEKDMVLFAADGRNILLSPKQAGRWWEATWFNLVSLALGAFGLIAGFIKG